MARLRKKRYGTRTEVMNGKARMTQGRLTKEDLTYNEYGYIFSYVIIFISLLMFLIVCFKSKKV